MGTRKQASYPAANSGAEHKPSPTIAKLTRPQASNAVLRYRLFKSLDEAQERPIVWIHGPPGAGKTTLLASYLTAKKRSGIWYQIDGDDGDPASFFYYLGLAATAKAPRKRRPMPLLTPEYLLDIERFTRRFFRELCARLGDTAVLVFDNYQEVAAPSVFHKVIACALSELALGTRVIVLSRTEPPPEYARHLANSLIAQIGWEDLGRDIARLTARIMVMFLRRPGGQSQFNAGLHPPVGYSSILLSVSLTSSYYVYILL